MFKVVIVDNTKAIVEIADPVKPKIVQGFLEYAQARRFTIDTTRVRRPCVPVRKPEGSTPLHARQ